MIWGKLSPGEARALGRIADLKHNPPKKLILGRDNGTLFVVPPSTKDQRRWNISKGGLIRRVPR